MRRFAPPHPAGFPVSEMATMVDSGNAVNPGRLSVRLLHAACDAALKAGKCLLFGGMLALLNGCANFTLISFSTLEPLEAQEQWNELKEPRTPNGPVEEAAVKAAGLRSFVKEGQITAICLAADEKSQIVVAAVDTALKMDPMAPKSLTSYRIVDGRIDAFMATVTEPSPDIDYEMTVYSAAMGAMTSRNANVVIYQRQDRNLVMDASIKNECVITVRVVDGLNKTGDVISERRINICNRKTGNDGIALSKGAIPPTMKRR
jgi:hypothetical protein